MAERANALMTASSRDAATENAFARRNAIAASDVASAIQHAAMLAVVMRRVKKLARGAAPTSWEQFAAIVERSQAEATEEELGKARSRWTAPSERRRGRVRAAASALQELLLAAPGGNGK